MVMDAPDFSGFINEFVEEAEEHLQTLNACLLNIEQSAAAGAPNREKIDSLFRAAHTVKGLAGMMEFENIERLCHRMEDIFGEIRHGQMPITAGIIDALFAAADALAKLIAAVREGGADKGVEIGAPMALMDKALLGGKAAVVATPQKKGREKKKISPADMGISLNAATLGEKDLAMLEDAVTAGLWIYELGKEFTGGTPLEKIHRLPIFHDIEQAGMLITALPPVEHIPGASGTVNCRFIFGSDRPPAVVREIFMDPVSILKEGWAAAPAGAAETEPPEPEEPEQRTLNEILAQLDETLIQEFIKSASDHLDQIDLALLELERDPAGAHIAAEIHDIFRSYKGKAALFGFNKIALLAGKLDGIFGQIQNQRVTAGTELFEAVAASMEKLRRLLDELKLRKETGVTVTADLKRLDALVGKTKRSPEELQKVLALSALDPAVVEQLSPAEQALIAEEYDKGRAIYQIVIRFGEDAMKSGYEPLSIVPVVEKSGDILVSIPLIDGVPEIFRYEADKWGIGFHFLLATDISREQLNSRFAMLPRFMEIDLREVLCKKTTPKAAPHRLAAAAQAEPATAPLSMEHDMETAGENSAAEAEKKIKERAVNTIRVDIERLDKLLNLIGELVIDRTRLEQLSAEMRKRLSADPLAVQLTHTNQLFQRHINEVQDMVMSIRMVPIGNAFNKFPRIVRDMAKSLGKTVNLSIVGEDTELDKTIIEEVGDPLIHLIRNAIDHGIESPDERRAAGKPETGQVALKAYHEGDTIIIEVSDDGQGMNIEKIRDIAVQKGLLDPAAATPSEKEMLQFIFEPGFSTTAVPTMVSGRGVGMDVVKKNIVKLKGLIDIFSEKGKGCTIRLRLPLTLAIVPTLIVGVREETFAIPLSSVAESLRIAVEDIRMVNGREMITLRDTVLPLARLDELFMLDRKPLRKAPLPAETTEPVLPSAAAIPFRVGRARRNSVFIVVVGLAEKRLGLVVSDLKRQQEVVIKNLGEMLKDAPGISGATIMGDGRVALILDVGQIIEDAGRRQRQQPATSMKEG
ncbi:MAG: Hpt domain-containing protein [Nitrospinae bacterium]|nr:Hpt domain-containing protein [Nitrospinota bacterium]